MLKVFEKNSWFSWTITTIIAAVIFYLSSLEFAPGTPTTNILSIIYHIMAFFFLTLFLLISSIKRKHLTLIPLALILSFIYSILDEVHQYFVPGRSSGLFDIMINTTGIIFGFILYYIFIKLKQ